MMRCFRCEKSGREVKLNDAIYENDLVKVCERCAITESIPILRKPSTSQLRAAERSQGVYERLKRLSGQSEPERTHESVLDKIKKLDENPEMEKPEEKPFSLINNYHWHAARARRNRGLSQKQLAWALGESETAIKMVEKGDLPEEPEKLIRKLEQFFQIHLRERTREEIEAEKRRREEFRMPKVEVITEPIRPILEEEINEEDLADVEITEDVVEEAGRPAQVLKFKPELMDNITIADLKKMKDEKEAEETSSVKEDLKKKEVMEKVGQEMKNFALGKESDLISEKRAMLNRAMQKVSKEEKKDHVPSINELMEKRRDKEKSKLEEEKLRVQVLEKKSEQEQIKNVLRDSQASQPTVQPSPQPTVHPLPETKPPEPEPKPPEPTLSELADKKKQEKEESLLGDDIEIIED